MGMTIYPVVCFDCEEQASTTTCYRCGKLLCQSCAIDSSNAMCESCGWFIIDKSIEETIIEHFHQHIPHIRDIQEYLKWSYTSFEIYGEGYTDTYLIKECEREGLLFKTVSKPEQEAKVGCIRWI